MGKSVLIVDRDKTFGGAWKTITIDGIEDVENAIHYFWPPDDKGIEFMKDTLGFDIEPSQRKYRYFKFFNFGFVNSFFLGRLDSCIIVFTTSTKRRTFHSLKNMCRC